MARTKQVAGREGSGAHKRPRDLGLKTTRPMHKSKVVVKPKPKRSAAAAQFVDAEAKESKEESDPETEAEPDSESEPAAEAAAESQAAAPEPASAAETLRVQARCEKLLKKWRATRQLSEAHKAYLVKHGFEAKLRKPRRLHPGTGMRRLAKRLQKKTDNHFSRKSFRNALDRLLMTDDGQALRIARDAEWDLQMVMESLMHNILSTAVATCREVTPHLATLKLGHLSSAAYQHFRAMPGNQVLAWGRYLKERRLAEAQARRV